MPHSYEERFGFLVSDIARLQAIQFDRRGRQRLVLSRAQCRVALYLSTLGPMSQAKLAETLDVTPMTVARMLDRMQEAGWVQRVPAPNDRRAFMVQATDKVEDALGPALALGDEITALAMQGLSDTERKTLLRLLSVVRGNLASGQAGD
ncbi:MarR family winged helix-turn-helix transcriptional regulator [Bordetella sp. FB-8]|uniref:MarR family winged helix-turn-helix transcriptional regulator n=1 Tax=Bordetella sp. FB-8 TaxID=1159870 RepID=UPI0003822245|nr:MarR family transcriptional regulator [Bordetella sp. FB-8]